MLYEYGAKEVHIRIACPPLIYSCPFVGFTASKGDSELITRRVIKELEGDEKKNLEKYATTGSPEYEKMVEVCLLYTSREYPRYANRSSQCP